MSPHPSAPSGVTRTPVQFDARTGDLRIGPYGRHVPDPAQPEQVYGAYLSLLYAVRGARPGERLALRTADLEALLLIVGDDPETIESRLIDLMGCTPAEAGVLGRLLLRQRRATATLGIAAGLTLAGVGLVTQLTGDEQSAPVSVESQASSARTAAEQPVVGPQRVAPVPAGSVSVGPVSPVSVAPVPVAPEPVAATAPRIRAAVVGPQAPPAPAAPAPAAPAPAAPAPVAAAPVAAAPVAAAPVAAPPAPAPVQPAAEQPVEVAPEDRYVMPLEEEPVWDAPPPVDVPESDIGDAASLEPELLQPISGVTDSTDHGDPEPISGVTDSVHDEPVESVEPEAAPEAAEPVAAVEAAAEPAEAAPGA